MSYIGLHRQMPQPASLEADDARMAAAKTDRELSALIHDVEARLDAEHAPAEVRAAFQLLKRKHAERVLGVIRG